MQPETAVTGGSQWFDEHLDPAYRQGLARADSWFPPDYEQRDPQARRVIQESTFVPEPRWMSQRIIWEDRHLVRQDSEQRLRVRLYQPRQASQGLRPAVVCVHGGGMWAGTIESEHATFGAIAADQEAVCLSVDYRLAPEYPYPAAIEDIDTALRWLVEQADTLAIDRDRIALYGGSAGGGLVVGEALYARDHGSPSICFVQALYPMIDPRSATASSHQVQRESSGAWKRSNNIEAWQWYLADTPADIYAAPALASVNQLRGLPPTYIDVGELDLFRDENLAFASRLSAAGVPTELHLLTGLFHGAENVVPDAPSAQWLWRTRREAMTRRLHPLAS